ncbi:MAG: hypothetical protein KBC69_01150 [Candidatus Magasanikbacteria bacterium]|nr:hypothetical protein [Candidatus Magasanikbacteria bacterium]
MDKISTFFEKAIQEAIAERSAVIPPPFLSAQIMSVIAKKRRFYAFVRLGIFSLFSICSSVGSVLILRVEWPSIAQSEAAQLLSLLFSDFSVIVEYWREYVLSLLESLPLISMILIAVFIWATSALLWMTIRTYVQMKTILRIRVR